MSFTATIDNAYARTQQRSGDLVLLCACRCGQEIDEDAERCEQCRDRFASDCLKRTADGIRICACCVAKQQEIIGSSVRTLEMVIERARAGKYLTDDEFREAVEAWRVS